MLPLRISLLALLAATGPAFAQVAEGPPQPPKLERPPTPPQGPATPAPRTTNMDRPPASQVAAPRGQPTAPETPAPQASASAAPRGMVAARVLARVNGQPILFEEVLNAAAMDLESIRGQVPEAQWAAVKEEYLQRRLDFLIDTEVLIQDAGNRVQPKVLQGFLDQNAKEFDKKLKTLRDKLKLATDAELKRRLEAEGYSLDEMRRQYARNLVAVQYFSSLMKDKMDEIDREEMLEYWRTHQKEFERPELITWHHLFLDANKFISRVEARALAEQLHAFVFAQQSRDELKALAQKHSHSPDRFAGGENQDPPGQIRPPEVLDAILKLAPGQTAPIIETEAGFHIVKLLSHQQAGVIPFSEACQDIKTKLTAARWDAELMKTTKRLRAKATIESGLGKEGR